MTELQQAFNEVWNWFSKPDAVLGRGDGPDGQGSCIYWGPANVRCAIGCRLSADWVALHGTVKVNASGSIYGLSDVFPEVENIIGVKDSPLWRFHSEMQGEHDSSQTVNEFLAKMRDLAVDWKLTVPGDVQEPIVEQELVTV